MTKAGNGQFPKKSGAARTRRGSQPAEEVPGDQGQIEETNAIDGDVGQQVEIEALNADSVAKHPEEPLPGGSGIKPLKVKALKSKAKKAKRREQLDGSSSEEADSSSEDEDEPPMKKKKRRTTQDSSSDSEHLSSDEDDDEDEQPAILFGVEADAALSKKLAKNIKEGKFVEMALCLVNEDNKEEVRYNVKKFGDGTFGYVRDKSNSKKIISFGQWCMAFDVFMVAS